MVPIIARAHFVLVPICAQAPFCFLYVTGNHSGVHMCPGTFPVPIYFHVWEPGCLATYGYQNGARAQVGTRMHIWVPEWCTGTSRHQNAHMGTRMVPGHI